MLFLRERLGRLGSFAVLIEGTLSFGFISSKVHSPGGQQGPRREAPGGPERWGGGSSVENVKSDGES